MTTKARIVNAKDFDKPKTEINPIGSNEDKDFAGQIVKIANSINSVLGTFKNMIGEAAEIKEAYKKINSKEEKPIQQAQPIQPMQTENSIKGEPKTIEVKKVIETPLQEVPEQKEIDYNKVAAVLFERLKAELDHVTEEQRGMTLGAAITMLSFMPEEKKQELINIIGTTIKEEVKNA